MGIIALLVKNPYRIFYNSHVQTLHVPLLGKKEIAYDTYAFIFPRPKPFSYESGQYISLSVEKPEIAAPSGTMREFSLVSAPYEKTLEVALRYRETPAKKQYHMLNTGDMAYIQGPFGTFHFEKDSSQIIMLAGGIGIAPFLSMIKQSVHEREDREFYLFFSNRFERDIPYLRELTDLREKTDRLTVVTTLSKETHHAHEEGYISPLLLEKHLTPLPDATYYISGPQRFVGGMWEVLETLGVEDTAIHGEEFTGYE